MHSMPYCEDGQALRVLRPHQAEKAERSADPIQGE
jgi:hypothetical protein